MSNAQPANTPNATEVMGRKAFDAFLYDLYGKTFPEENNVRPDIEVHADDIYRVEVFNSPEGLVIAAHELHAANRPWVGLQDIGARQEVECSVHVKRPRLRS